MLSLLSVWWRNTDCKSSEEPEGGFRAGGEYHAQDSGGDEGADARLPRESDDDGSGHEHHSPDQPGQVRS